MSTPGACFATETGRVGGCQYWQFCLEQNHISKNIGDGYFGGRNKVQIVFCIMVHLTFFVRQLPGAVGRGFVYKVRHLVFDITGIGVFV